jgi:hypothetical protein
MGIWICCAELDSTIRVYVFLCPTGALNRKGWEYEVDEGGGAFYGPKIDIKIRDAIGTSPRHLSLCVVFEFVGCSQALFTIHLC